MGLNPNYSKPQAPELFFEIETTGPTTNMGKVFDGLELQSGNVAVSKRASFATANGLSVVLVWEEATVRTPRIKHDVSVEGLEGWHDLVQTVQQAQALAMRLDEAFQPGEVVVPDEVSLSTLEQIVRASHTVKVEALQFLAGAPALRGDTDSDQCECDLCVAERRLQASPSFAKLFSMGDALVGAPWSLRRIGVPFIAPSACAKGCDTCPDKDECK